MKFPHIVLLFILLFSVAFASEDSLGTLKADSLRAELDSINALDNSTPGVLITGEFRSGILSSVLYFEDAVKTGINAATEADIKLQARPTKETRATVLFRVHQDWQKSHEEGTSPVLLNWLSYDGKAWGGRIDFNLGDMRIAYTPLTIYTPLLDIANEAEIFASLRRDAMAYQNLQNDGRRLLQGLNFEMHSGNALLFDDLYLQGTLSRLRAQPRKEALEFFDYDDTDRILFAGRGGLALYGISLGLNYVYTFTREESLKNLTAAVAIDPQLNPDGKIPFLIEDVSVLSVTLGVDIAKLAGLADWKIALGGEYAKSNYKTALFFSLRTDESNLSKPSIRTDSIASLPDIDGTAMLATIDVLLPRNLANAGLKLDFIKNDENFVSELAQNPVYYTPASVLNASAVDLIRGTTLENLYFATYTNDPLTQYNLANNSATTSSMSGNPYRYERLNNNKKAHFLRSGYTNTLMTPSELRSVSVEMLDPGVNLSMPFGLATPNRQGVLLKAECSLLQDKLGINVFANKIEQLQTESVPYASFLDAGGGFVVEVGKFIGLSQTIRLNGGYGTSTETDGYERSVNRTSAGLRAGIWNKLFFLVGMEMLNKDYGSSLGEATTGKEMLLLFGPEFELARGSYINLQSGLLNYEFKNGDNEPINFNRNLISADVRIKF